MRCIKPYNDEGFKYIKTTLTGTKGRNGKIIVQCPTCGREFEVFQNSYYRNNIRCSCEIHHKRLFSIYTNIKTRCYNPNSPAFRNYGGRGITMCDEWLLDYKNFEIWALSHGYSDELTIDRIIVDGNYSPENCRWVDVVTQANNKRNNIKVDGISLCRWCKQNNINYKTVHTSKSRHKDMTVYQILSKYIELEEGEK